MKRATDEHDVQVFRTERFFNAGGQWYFATREMSDLGPFISREAAESALNEYLMQRAGVVADPWSVPGARR